MKAPVVLLLIIFISHSFSVWAQTGLLTTGQLKALTSLSNDLDHNNSAIFTLAAKQAATKGWRIYSRSASGSYSVLKGVDSRGFPIYLKTFNTTSAATTQTTAVQPGGSLGLKLSGSSPFLKGKIAIWDEGIVYAAHNEFAGKTITVGDGSAYISSHTTHVAGTMIAKGAYDPAQGMAFGAATLQSFDFNNDQSEMAGAAKDLLISNHSYGYEAGWNYNTTQNRWEWDGLPGDTVDYKFGYYSADAQVYDEIAFFAPQYLIVEAAGNSHDETGPPIGDIYYGYASRTDATLVNKGPRPAGLSDNSGYDVISGTANSKNILTVGAVYQLPMGPSKGAVQIAPFSSWGPTDDGRIKPDLCGNGTNVISSGSASPNDYLTLSGTSTATPNVSGSIFLLQEYFAQLNHGTFMRSATLKGLVCHTAYDAGNPGPDYIYGWGLLDMDKAAQCITNEGITSLINEQTIIQGQTQTITVKATGTEPLKITLSWTDPPGALPAYGIINDRTPKLVNDLDLRVTDGNTIYSPWVLNPERPAENASKGDNIRDNIEQIMVDQPVADKIYTITVNHKGRLLYGLQNYSLIATGVQNATSTESPAVDLVNVYPVPAANQFTISLQAVQAGKLSIRLYSLNGSQVYADEQQMLRGAFVTTVNVAKLPSGIYIVKLVTTDKVIVKKIIVAGK